MSKCGEKILTRDQAITLGLYGISVITSDMLEGYTSIGEDALRGFHSLTSVIIPNNITNIGAYAFSDCMNLNFVTIPDSVTSIGKCAFDDCDKLKYVIIGNNVANIMMGTFGCCSSLTSVNIPNSVTHIEGYAFYYCSSLTSINIPDSVTSIGEHAFCGCNNLTSVIIRNEVYEVHKVVNGKCKAYKGFDIDMKCRDFQYEEDKTYRYDGKPKLCEQGFHACLNIADVFSYYYGEFGKDIVVHEVELEGVSNERGTGSKIVGNKITIGKRIL